MSYQIKELLLTDGHSPFAEWFDILRTHRFEGMDGAFIHPVSDPAVMAGNGTIGLEILEDLPEVDAILVPYGGGGLSCGIASAVAAMRPATRVYACEVETAAPLAASLAAGEPRTVPYTASFVDGIGSPSLLPKKASPSRPRRCACSIPPKTSNGTRST